jgi:spore maturation protein B
MLLKIFPAMLGLFISVGFIRNSGLMDTFKTIISPVSSIFGIPEEILPLVLIRPISGSASLAIVADIFKNYGVDSKVGVIASIMMGTTETIMYVVAVYFGVVGIKNLRYILVCALIAEFFSVLLSVGIVNLMMN